MATCPLSRLFILFAPATSNRNFRYNPCRPGEMAERLKAAVC